MLEVVCQHVSLRYPERGGTYVDGYAVSILKLAQQCNQKSTRPSAQIGNRKRLGCLACVAQERARGRHEGFAIRPRIKDAGSDFQVEAPKLAPTQDA